MAFLGQLVDDLVQKNKYKIERESSDGADIVIQNRHTGNIVLIETKDAGSYGELPISFVLQIPKMNRQMDDMSKCFLTRDFPLT